MVGDSEDIVNVALQVLSADAEELRDRARSEAYTMFGRKKTATAPSLANLDGTVPLSQVVDQTVAAGIDDRPVTAREAYAVASTLVRRVANDARIVLIVSADVDVTGCAPFWAFHYLFPAMRAEGVATVKTATERRSDVPELHLRLTPFPAPGSPEHAMAENGGQFMALLIQEKWTERLARISGLPTEFRDSSEAIVALASQGALLHGEQVRMKARMLPTGQYVWELATPSKVLHYPMGTW